MIRAPLPLERTAVEPCVVAEISINMARNRLEGVRVCIFDAYGTLFDYTSATSRCRDVLGENFDQVNALWREKQLQYSWLRAAQCRLADFWQVTGEALDFALDTVGIADSTIRDRLMAHVPQTRRLS